MRLAANRLAAPAAPTFVAGAIALLMCFSVGWQRGSAAGALREPVWIETTWPFLMDQWGEGKAFQCGAADCGVELKLFIRPKIGFCSATVGVADDDELDRLTDFGFMTGAVSPLGRGHQVNVAWMKGRARTYAVVSATGQRTTALSIAYNNDSDALVATVVLNDAQFAPVEAIVIKFLDGDMMQRWVTHRLGLS